MTTHKPQETSAVAAVQKQQTGAAIVLGLVVLAVIVLRAWHGGALPPHWWRHW